jgi:hypothetical protein
LRYMRVIEDEGDDWAVITSSRREGGNKNSRSQNGNELLRK